MKRYLCILCCATMLFLTPVSTFASDNPGQENVAITVVVPEKTEAPPPTPKLVVTPKRPSLYPVSVSETAENGRQEIIKIYELSAAEKPENIPSEAFTRNGFLYELTDITKKETASADMKAHTETVTMNSATKELEAILKLLPTQKELKTDDDYMGVLAIDVSTIKVEVAGTKTTGYTSNVVREYPSLTSNDISLIPKTISQGGGSLTLSGVKWRTQNTETLDSDQLPDSYTAVATYSRSGTKTSVTGYTTTAQYKGNVSKMLAGKTVYTAYFVGTPIVTPVLQGETVETSTKPENTPTPNAPSTAVTVTPTTATVMPTTHQTSASVQPTSTTQPPHTTKQNEKQKSNATPLVVGFLLIVCGGGYGYYKFIYKKKGSEKL